MITNLYEKFVKWNLNIFTDTVTPNVLQYIGYYDFKWKDWVVDTSKARRTIVKIETTGTVQTVSYPLDADGNQSADSQFVRDDRATYTYGA